MQFFCEFFSVFVVVVVLGVAQIAEEDLNFIK